MYKKRYFEWMKKCLQIKEEEDAKLKKRNSIILTTMAAVVNKKINKSYCKRLWIDEILQQRQYCGFYTYIFPILQTKGVRFNNYFRMSVIDFEELLCIVGPRIYKQCAVREAVSPAERLCITLRYLASGDMMSSMQYHYLRSLTTISNIIKETCEVIWDCLHCVVFPQSITPEYWLSIAKDFEEMWNFPHCIGAIDGKHIVIQCPDNAGSSFFNYKGSHSIVLLAICDANYKFTFVDIGSYGRGSDSSVFKTSTFGEKFMHKQMNLPNSRPISSDEVSLPYFLVGDEAFPLTEYLLRPYPGKNLIPEREIFNYRLSRARHTIENAFGILASQWRIFRRPIQNSVKTTEKIVKAAVCLHNYIRRESVDLDDNLTYSHVINSNTAMQDISRAGSNNSSYYAVTMRDEFCAYFNGEGAVFWQYDK